jgi:hypothetical protein
MYISSKGETIMSEEEKEQKPEAEPRDDWDQEVMGKISPPNGVELNSEQRGKQKP